MRSLSSLTLDDVSRTVRELAVPILVALALWLGATSAYLLRKLVKTQAQLRKARSAAEDAARAAALAAPGGIDPEVVLDILRRGVAPTLDNVYAAMRLQERPAAGQPPPAPAADAVDASVSAPS